MTLTLINGRAIQHLRRPTEPDVFLCGVTDTIPWTPKDRADSDATPVCTSCHRIGMHQLAAERDAAIIAPAGYVHPMQQSVALFHRAFEMPDLVLTPGPLPLSRIELRVGLIREEGVVELTEAIQAGNTVLAIDALIDTIYVALGGLVEMGGQVRQLPQVYWENPRHSREPITLDVVSSIENDLAALELALQNEEFELSVDWFSSIASTAHRALERAHFDPQPFFDEVQRANMSKLGADGKPVKSRGMELDGYPEGKVLKGAQYVAPNLQRVYDELYSDRD